MPEAGYTLSAEHCLPGRDVVLLKDPDAHQLLTQLANWEIEARSIRRTFTFDDFYKTIAFVNAVAWMANTEDHHPDLEVGYSTCTVRYTTHAAGGLTRNDFICAAKIDAMTAAR